ncbi:hypothetical protein CFOL_v3_31994 [Cephalotus follicularis]|uniref:Uncharacterized protein n=1 Tax=Cephalotus follicularis TaxID=3775 RepID=A0A1Q3D7Y7_CEPFO|nr:hypothetical protein CFOL_v3_31994 [Cephalotus follicularis]
MKSLYLNLKFECVKVNSRTKGDEIGYQHLPSTYTIEAAFYEDMLDISFLLAETYAKDGLNPEALRVEALSTALKNRDNVVFQDNRNRELNAILTKEEAEVKRAADQVVVTSKKLEEALDAQRDFHSETDEVRRTLDVVKKKKKALGERHSNLKAELDRESNLCKKAEERLVEYEDLEASQALQIIENYKATEKHERLFQEEGATARIGFRSFTQLLISVKFG